MKYIVIVVVLVMGGCLMMEKSVHEHNRKVAREEENKRSSARYRALDYISGDRAFVDDSDLEYLDDELENKVYDERKDRQDEMLRNLLTD